MNWWNRIPSHVREAITEGLSALSMVVIVFLIWLVLWVGL